MPVLGLLLAILLPACAGVSVPAGTETGPRRLELRFDEIPCPGHVRAILDAVNSLEGIDRVKVNFSGRTGRVDYDPAQVSPERILERIPSDCPAHIVSDRPAPAE